MMTEKIKDPKHVKVSEGELYLLASEMVMENMPFENKEFNPQDKDECVDKLKEMVKKKWLKISWIESAANANISNAHCLIQLDDKWMWSLMSGMSKAKYTRKEFLDELKKTTKLMKSGNVKLVNKDVYGKYYFKKQ